jgi:site-specific DNA recombinase
MNTIIYARVSTDEQAKGFSLDYQIEVMNKFCDLKGYSIIKSFKEDESAKDFGGRPEWTNLKSYILANKNEVDLVLVQKWDRYSRDIYTALGVLEEFRVMGVEVNSVEQWLDMNIPESKMMLSLYLSQGEVERHKISARVKDGNYKALSSGYYINKAPYGYRNIKIHDQKPSLLIVEDKSEFIKEAFQRVSTGIESAEYVLNCMRKRGFKMSKSNFLRTLRKVVYTGRIIVPAYKKEEESIVKGHHDAIIDMETYQKVQSVLNGKRWNGIIPSHKNELFPLRNYLICDCCGEKMTASSSKGRNKKHHYYHCRNKSRIRRDDVHNMFDDLLESLTFDEDIINLYRTLFEDLVRKDKRQNVGIIDALKQDISSLYTQIENIEDRLANDDIKVDTYNKIVQRYENTLRNKKTELSSLKKGDSPIENYMKNGLSLINNLSGLYGDCSYHEKRSIIGVIFPEKLMISKTKCRTTNLNTVVELLCRFNEGFRENKNGTNTENSDLSRSVLEAGLEPARPKEHRILSPACLPIPPLEHLF